MPNSRGRPLPADLNPAAAVNSTTVDSSRLVYHPDFHERVIDYASRLDRAFFEEHPGPRFYRRSPVEHEFCLGFGREACHRLFGWVEVHKAGDIGRLRLPVGRFLPCQQVGEPPDFDPEGISDAPAELLRRLEGSGS